ncbi:unnamed protein product [Ilex paraguariensis]|uniref:Uncharacterized protein n=1 Tax=Ilex paraguariensis TaxID=185542 RepID=A0ABC8S9X6_9AQUA
MRDSLAIEASFLQREEELLSSWWEEYAECSEGPRERSGSKSKSDPQAKVSSLESARLAHLHAIEEERVGVPVKGGLYEGGENKFRPASSTRPKAVSILSQPQSQPVQVRIDQFSPGSDSSSFSLSPVLIRFWSFLPIFLYFLYSLAGSTATEIFQSLLVPVQYFSWLVHQRSKQEKVVECPLHYLYELEMLFYRLSVLLYPQTKDDHVDLVKRHCFPVYWNGENRRVLRGHWFASKGGLDWLPLREDVTEQLEYAYHCQVWHRRTFQPSGLFAARVDLQGSTPGLHALFTGEDDTWEAWLNVDASGFSSVINFGGNGIKLRRGYAPCQSSKPTQVVLFTHFKH